MPDLGSYCLPDFASRWSSTGCRCRAVAVAASAMLFGGCLMQPTKQGSALLRAAEPRHPDAMLTVFHDQEDFVVEPQWSGETVNAYRITTEGRDLWQRLREGFRLGPVNHPRIDRERQRLLQHPPALHALIERSRPYLHHVLSSIEARDLPTELALLPGIESSYRPFAYSPDGATGLWQFMPATARRFGLKRNWWCDARRDTLSATTAALDYVAYLLYRFDDNYLHALAAYNAGAAKVSRAIRHNRRKGRSTEFWSLDLPGETDRYVPRLLALAQIVQQPEAFNVDLPSIDDKPYFEIIETDFQVDLQVAARLIEMPLEDFLDLNAGFNRAATQPDGPHRLLVPRHLAADLRRSLQDLPPEQRLRWRRHTIRPGDTLRELASRHQVTVNAIQRANHLTTHQIRATQELLIPLSESVAVTLARANTRGERVSYRVRKGDSLYVIAKRFQVTVTDLRRWNDIVGRLIKPGQKLTLFLRDG